MSNPYEADVQSSSSSSSFPLSDNLTVTTVMTSLPYGYVLSLASFFAFAVIRSLVSSRLRPPKSVVTSSDLWKWKNITVSFVHSSVIGVCCAISFFKHPEILEDLIDINNPFIYTVASISTGYFLYDFYDVVANGQSRSQWEVLLHHVAVLNSFIYNITNRRFVGYTMAALIVELNTIFLHLRKLLQMYGRSDYICRVVKILNLLTFVVCRFAFSLSMITYGIFAYADKMSTYYFWSLSATIVLTWIVNVILFMRLVKSDLLRRRRNPAESRALPKDSVTSLHPVAVDATVSNGYKLHDVYRNNNIDVVDFRPKRQ